MENLLFLGVPILRHFRVSQNSSLEKKKKAVKGLLIHMQAVLVNASEHVSTHATNIIMRSLNFSEITENRQLKVTLDAMTEIGLSADFQQSVIMV